MGASFQTTCFKDCTSEDLVKKWNNLIKQLIYDHGHDQYNGTFSTCRGFQVTNVVFNSDMEAEEWLSNNTDKWAEAVAVKVLSPTPHWMVGGLCAE